MSETILTTPPIDSTTKKEAATPTILAEDESTRIVQLSAEYAIQYHNRIRIFMATMSTTRVHFTRLSTVSESTQFSLSDEEADAFCEAWTTWKTDQAVKAEKEKQRASALLKEAYTLAAQSDDIRIEAILSHNDDESDDETGWHITTKNALFSRFDYSEDELLVAVQQAMSETQ